MLTTFTWCQKCSLISCTFGKYPISVQPPWAQIECLFVVHPSMITYPSSPHPYPVPCAFGEYPVSVKNVLNYFSSPLQSKATFISEFYISILASAFMSTDTFSSTKKQIEIEN